MKMERLDKLLCASGRYSRSQARSAILSGNVTVDGDVIRRPEAKVPRDAAVCAGGETVDTAEFVYYMLNKPAGYISGAKDEKYPAVTSLLPPELQKRGLFCAGRLDADVTGLLILTDDGAYAHRVTAPRSETPKTYEVRLDGALTKENIEALARGVTLASGVSYRPAALEIDSRDPCLGHVTVTEGKYHEVKNLMAFCGRQVVSMRRLSIGALALDEGLAEGRGRRMTEAEAQTAFHKNV